MKKFIILFILLAIAVVVSPQLIEQQGYVLITFGGWIIESTILAAFLIVVSLVWLTLIIIRVYRNGFRVSRGAWRHLLFSKRRRAEKNFRKGLAAYVFEDFDQAEQLLSQDTDGHDFELSAYLVAADCAEKQTKLDKTKVINNKHYLDKIQQLSQEAGEPALEAGLVQIKLLMAQQAYLEARTKLDELHKWLGHDAKLLTLEIQLCFIEKRFQQIVDYFKLAEKLKVSSQLISQWQYDAYYGLFNDLIMRSSANQLEQQWQKLSKKERNNESILLAYCQVLAEHHINQQLLDILIKSLKKYSSEGFINRLKILPIKKPEALISMVQKQLQKNPHSSKWLSYLGHLALADQQWQMAEKVFMSLINIPEAVYQQEDIDGLAKAQAGQGHWQSAYENMLKAAKLVNDNNNNK